MKKLFLTASFLGLGIVAISAQQTPNQTTEVKPVKLTEQKPAPTEAIKVDQAQLEVAEAQTEVKAADVEVEKAKTDLVATKKEATTNNKKKKKK